jgi:hypothetical protein
MEILQMSRIAIILAAAVASFSMAVTSVSMVHAADDNAAATDTKPPPHHRYRHRAHPVDAAAKIVRHPVHTASDIIHHPVHTTSETFHEATGTHPVYPKPNP